MDINNVNGASAYANALNVNQKVDQAPPQNQNAQSPNTGAGNPTDNSQMAFEVNLTQEALKISASQTLKASDQPPAPPSDQASQTTSKPYETSQIVNIVA